ncbi:PAS domain-containing protein [Dankookia sp. P2]|uniref:PAS domain-containing protein n=1 Tax=Dankookia sp. P2 TaxID=3423955 RepID=UPI003D679414
MASERLLRRPTGPSGFLESFRLLADPAPEGLAVLDSGGRVLAANPALAALAGPLAAPRPGSPAAVLLAPSAREAFVAALASGLKAVPRRRCESRLAIRRRRRMRSGCCG